MPIDSAQTGPGTLSFAAAAAVAAADRRLLRNDVYELLLDHILNGAFRPGERLKDAELTAWLGVSRTPVREALSRLVSVGLVQTAPNRYTIVAPLVSEEVVGAVAVLRRLYPDAIREGIDRPGADDEVRLEVLAARLQRGEAEPGEAFRHGMSILLDRLENQVLAETVEAVQLRMLRYLALDPAAAGLLNRERVTEFIRAITEGDGRAADLIDRLLAATERSLAG
jgi:DNA-binding GntR family transcriptional regulator